MITVASPGSWILRAIASNFGSRPRPASNFVRRVSSLTDVAAILLAAGRSRRMGAFKPLLPFDKSTVIESCLESLRSAGIEDIIVVVGHRADAVRKQLKDFDVKFAINPDPDSEMNASIACGIERI